MPSPNPVSQPTTITLEFHDGRPANHITIHTTQSSCFQKKKSRQIVLGIAICFAISGLGCVIFAVVKHAYGPTPKDKSFHDDPKQYFHVYSGPTTEEKTRKKIEKVVPDDIDYDFQNYVLVGSLGLNQILMSLVFFMIFFVMKGVCRRCLPQPPNLIVRNMNASRGAPAHGESGHQTAISYRAVQVKRIQI